MSQLVLAESSNVAIWLFGAQMLFNLLFTLLMWALNRKVKSDDNLRKRVEEQDATIRAQVDAAVDQKIGALSDSISRLESRLEIGDKQFADLAGQDHKAELKLQQEVHQLHMYVTKHCATKSAMDQLVKQINALREDVIRVQNERGAV